MPRPWHRGRVVRAGNAAHTTTPHLALGAGIAIEGRDRSLRAHLGLAAPGSPQDALERYAERRVRPLPPRRRELGCSSVRGSSSRRPMRDPVPAHARELGRRSRRPALSKVLPRHRRTPAGMAPQYVRRRPPPQQQRLRHRPRPGDSRETRIRRRGTVHMPAAAPTLPTRRRWARCRCAEKRWTTQQAIRRRGIRNPGYQRSRRPRVRRRGDWPCGARST